MLLPRETRTGPRRIHMLKFLISKKYYSIEVLSLSLHAKLFSKVWRSLKKTKKLFLSHVTYYVLLLMEPTTLDICRCRIWKIHGSNLRLKRDDDVKKKNPENLKIFRNYVTTIDWTALHRIPNHLSFTTLNNLKSNMMALPQIYIRWT